MRRTTLAMIMIPLIFLMVSCKSKSYYEAMKAPEKLFYQGKYLEGARMLLPEVNKRGKDQLLFMMEAGYMLHAGGDFKKSNKVLLKAAKIARVKPISVTKQISALLTNQTKTNYRGEDFEKVLIHMYLGINFLMLKKYESARVEFKSVNNELSKIKIGKSKKARYKQNIMAKYLTAIAFEIIGDAENDDNDREYAYVEYKQIHKLEPQFALAKRDLLRMTKKLKYNDEYRNWKKKFGNIDRIPKNAGELITIFQAGRAPIKKSRGSLLKDKGMKASVHVALNTTSLAAGVTIVAIMATMKSAENPIPKYKKRSNKIKHVQINIKGRNNRTQTLEDIEYTAIKNLKDDYSRLKKHVAASIITKAVASIAAGLIAREIASRQKGALGAFSGLIGLAVGAGTGAALFSQMKPDLRCWHTLPAKLHLSRLFLYPGKYIVNCRLIGYNGKIQGKEKFNVEIKKGEKFFINLRTLK